MGRSGPTGLMAFWADIDPDYERRFLEWHNCEHMPERVSVPGFREGRRYRGLGDAPRYLMMYVTESAAVLGSNAYMARLDDPTPWTRESLGHFRRPCRNVYTRLAARGETSLRESPYLISIRFDVAPEAGDRVASSVRNALLPAWAGLDRVGRVTFHGIDAAVSGIETAERGIHEGGPGSQGWLLLVECARPEVAESADWRRAWDGVGGDAGGSGATVRHAVREAFRIDYALHAE